MEQKGLFMSREDRLHRLQQLLRSRRSIPMSQLTSELEVKRATVTRYLKYLRDTFGVPISWDPSMRGYQVDRAKREGDTGLLGLWFSPSELHALLTMDQLLEKIGSGFLKSHIEPL